MTSIGARGNARGSVETEHPIDFVDLGLHEGECVLGAGSSKDNEGGVAVRDRIDLLIGRAEGYGRDAVEAFDRCDAVPCYFKEGKEKSAEGAGDKY
jgi:hypothetical protein